MGFPVDVAITPNGKFAYVTNGGPNITSVIATASNTVVATIPAGCGVFPAVAITPNGKFAYVTCASLDRVSVVDTATTAVVGDTIPVGNHPAGMAITPNGKFAYVTGSEVVSVIATASNTVVATIPTERSTFGIAITPNGKFAYVALSTLNARRTDSVRRGPREASVPKASAGKAGPSPPLRAKFLTRHGITKAKSTNARKHDIPKYSLAEYRAFCKSNKHDTALTESTKARKAVIGLD